MAGFGTNRCTPVCEIVDRSGYKPSPPREVERARLGKRQRGCIRVDCSPCPSKYARDARPRRRCRGSVALASPVNRIPPPAHHRARRCRCQRAGAGYGKTEKALACEPACGTKTPFKHFAIHFSLLSVHTLLNFVPAEEEVWSCKCTESRFSFRDSGLRSQE